MPVLNSWTCGVQSALDSVATTFVGLRYIQGEMENVVNYDVAQYDRNTRFVEGDALPLTRYSTWKLTGRVDSREFPRLLVAFFGYGFGSLTHTYTMGVVPTYYLTLRGISGITGEMWQALNVVGDKLTFTADWVGGLITFEADLIGYFATQPTLAAASYAAYTGRDPLMPWQTPMTRNGSLTGCFQSLKWNVDNHVAPSYCAPAAALATPGMPPSDIEAGPFTGAYDLSAKYTVYAASPLAAFEASTEEAYVVTSTYDLTTDHVMTTTLPRAKATKGRLDWDPTKNHVTQMTSGPLLLHDSTAATITVVNGIGTYVSN